MTRLGSQDGFTLVELLVAMVIGVFVILAAFALLDAGAPLAKKTQDRIDAVQQGRLALDTVTKELRSQVCLDQPGTTAALSAVSPTISDDDDVWFYTNTGDQNSLTQRRHIYLSSGSLKEDMWQGTGTLTNTTFPATPTQSRVLASPVALAPSPNNKVFTYQSFDASRPQASIAVTLTTPLSASDAYKVVQMRVSFVVRPKGATAATKQDETMAENVYLRTADPRDADNGAKCA